MGLWLWYWHYLSAVWYCSPVIWLIIAPVPGNSGGVKMETASISDGDWLEIDRWTFLGDLERTDLESFGKGSHPDVLQLLLSFKHGDTVKLTLAQNKEILSQNYAKEKASLSRHCYYHCVPGGHHYPCAINICKGRINGLIYSINGKAISITSKIDPNEGLKLWGMVFSVNESGIQGKDFYQDAYPRRRNESVEDDKLNNLRRSRRNTDDTRLSYPDYYGDYAFETPLWIELVLVHDHTQLYHPFNIKVALRDVEIWDSGDQITVTKDGDLTLTNFLYYRRQRLVHQMPNDNAQLLTGVVFNGGVVGKALKGPMCSYKYSGGVNMDHSDNVVAVATTVAHELGHNFGMEHDNDSCECPQGRCIMSSASGGIPPSFWSSCSLEYLAWGLSHGADYCLRNKPTTLFQEPVCGNLFVEEGEECDCGLPEVCENSCCDARTCKRKEGADCAAGACCDLDTCQVKARKTVCRESNSDCDLSEYCDGLSPACPKDAHKHNGVPCYSLGQAFCYNGECASQESQCKLLWGATGRKSHDICYDLNVKGNENGNCGYNRNDKTFLKCSREDTQCGMLHCVHQNERTEFGDRSIVMTAHSFIPKSLRSYHVCRSALVDLGLSDMDPGLVPNGAVCGANKMCMEQKCVPVSDVLPDDTSNCNGRGVLNNFGNCHCDLGYAPPYCVGSGQGGSSDSGPPSDAKHGVNLAVGIPVFLFVVLPLLTFVVVMLYRCRHKLGKCYQILPVKSHSPVRQPKPETAGQTFLPPHSGSLRGSSSLRSPSATFVPSKSLEISPPIPSAPTPAGSAGTKVTPPRPPLPISQLQQSWSNGTIPPDPSPSPASPSLDNSGINNTSHHRYEANNRDYHQGFLPVSQLPLPDSEVAIIYPQRSAPPPPKPKVPPPGASSTLPRLHHNSQKIDSIKQQPSAQSSLAKENCGSEMPRFGTLPSRSNLRGNVELASSSSVEKPKLMSSVGSNAHKKPLPPKPQAVPGVLKKVERSASAVQRSFVSVKPPPVPPAKKPVNAAAVSTQGRPAAARVQRSQSSVSSSEGKRPLQAPPPPPPAKPGNLDLVSAKKVPFGSASAKEVEGANIVDLYKDDEDYYDVIREQSPQKSHGAYAAVEEYISRSSLGKGTMTSSPQIASEPPKTVPKGILGANSSGKTVARPPLLPPKPPVVTGSNGSGKGPAETLRSADKANNGKTESISSSMTSPGTTNNSGGVKALTAMYNNATTAK